MSVASDLEARVRERIAELEPLVAEYDQLLGVLDAFEAATKAGAEHGPRRRLGRAPASRRRAGSARAEQALELVRTHPGITVAELAETMGIGPTYLYKLLPGLEREGTLRKVGTGYEPA